jgi:hypothetical protein
MKFDFIMNLVTNKIKIIQIILTFFLFKNNLKLRQNLLFFDYSYFFNIFLFQKTYLENLTMNKKNIFIYL